MKMIPVGNDACALVDDSDYSLVAQFNWWANKRKHTTYARAYVCNDGLWRFEYMHRLLMRPPKGRVVDHINHDGLDNQRHNLRNVTVRDNALNRITRLDRGDIFVGVHWYSPRRRWRTMVGAKYIGLFASQEEAVQARNSFIAASLVAN